VLVRSDLKGQGLGRVLLEKLIRYCRDRGTSRMAGEVLSDNLRMTHLAAAVGFKSEARDRGILNLTLEMSSDASSTPPVAAC
jgi:acetyltransferase